MLILRASKQILLTYKGDEMLHIQFKIDYAVLMVNTENFNLKHATAQTERNPHYTVSEKSVDFIDTYLVTQNVNGKGAMYTEEEIKRNFDSGVWVKVNEPMTALKWARSTLEKLMTRKYHGNIKYKEWSLIEKELSAFITKRGPNYLIVTINGYFFHIMNAAFNDYVVLDYDPKSTYDFYGDINHVLAYLIQDRCKVTVNDLVIKSTSYNECLSALDYCFNAGIDVITVTAHKRTRKGALTFHTHDLLSNEPTPYIKKVVKQTIK